jgi:hypothetical protein
MVPEESTTPDLGGLSRRAIEAVGRGDFDGAMPSCGPSRCGNTSALGLPRARLYQDLSEALEAVGLAD